MDVAEARRLVAERGWFWARCADNSPIPGKHVRVDGVADNLPEPRLLWSAQPLWFGDAGASDGIWPPELLEPYDGDGEPAWRDRHGT